MRSPIDVIVDWLLAPRRAAMAAEMQMLEAQMRAKELENMRRFTREVSKTMEETQ